MNKPFLLQPIGKDYLWGGNKLNTIYNKEIEISPFAESWDCSTHEDGICFIRSGDFKNKTLKDVLKSHPYYLGKHSFNNEGELPILVKLIDSKDDLSIQVHPDDIYAKEKENNQLGKTEMWYVLDAEKESSIIYGFKQEINEDELIRSIAEEDIEKYLQKVKIKKDEVYLVNPGTIHAIGKGCLIAEIQENSNLTYRLYDYNRKDKNGNLRTLHIDKACDVINFNFKEEPHQPPRVLKYQKGEARELLSRCKYFEVYRMIVNSNEGICYQTNDLTFKVLECVEGVGSISFDEELLNIKKGDCIFVPAESTKITIKGKLTFLDIGC